MQIKQFLVLPKLPDKIKHLQELAHNLWYSWNPELVKLFSDMDERLWEQCNQNPAEMLASLPQEVLKSHSENKEFLARLERIYEKYNQYLNRKNWFHYKFGNLGKNTIGYFSLEYGLDTGLPVYSGGLGVLSGDTLKAASDLGIPMVAVGLLYRYGYFRQFLSAEGWQQERYEENDWYHMPVQRVKGKDDKPLQISIDLDGHSVNLQVWQVMVGRIPLYLLDANIPSNSQKVRDITSVLYGGDKEMRIRQEIILGVGGVRALKELGITPSIFHMNEGHSWFLALERMRYLIEEHKLAYNDALQYIWSTSVFTTHTPVPAGNERFEPILVQRYLGQLVSKLGVGWEEFLKLGRINTDDKNEPFLMTVAALKTSAFCNGVSKLHGEIARKMWSQIWPGLPVEEIPIKGITNGVHLGSWTSPEMSDLFSSYFGVHFVERPGAPEIWGKTQEIPDAELWRVHCRKREHLINFVRKRLKAQLLRRGTPLPEIQRVEKVLDPRILTIGFARRFSSYKRGNLIFSDSERLNKILNNDRKPVQIIISGKAHPLDNPGKEIIRQIIGYASEERFRDRIVFLEDYDINVASVLVQGCDVWLNNPRRPQEASGTSGMKAAINGGLHLSILDGWWAEAYNGQNGFKIGNGDEIENAELQDRYDAEMLYNTLEREVIPLFYNLNEIGLPAEWLLKMKNSIQTAGEFFSSQRMLMNYTDAFYVPAIDSSIRLSQNNFEPARQVSNWLDKMSHSWDKISIKSVDIPISDSELYVGQKLPISLEVYLGEISPSDVSIELISGRLNAQEQITHFQPIVLSHNSGNSASPNGTYLFSGEVTLAESGRFGVSARILPKNNILPHSIRPKMISWW